MRIILIFLIGFLFFSCEEEDICVEGSSPRLLVNFEKNSLNTKKIDSIHIFRLEDNSNLLVYKGVFRDNIKLPLSLEEKNFSSFKLKTYAMNQLFEDDLKIIFKYESSYVSKACGYKVVYKDLQAILKSAFFENIEILKKNIDDEANPHIRLSY